MPLATESKSYAIEAEGLGVTFGDARVLANLSLTIRAGEKVVILGPSGSGKTTLLHVLAGLTRAQTGRVRLLGYELPQGGGPGKPPEELYRNELGFVYQQSHLMPMFNTIENLIAPLLLAGKSLSTARLRAAQKLRDLGLQHLSTRPANALSGGERQRVAMARALVTQPSLIIMDEPTGSLDVETAKSTGEWLVAQARTEGVSVLIASHDLKLAELFDTRYKLESGRLTPAN